MVHLVDDAEDGPMTNEHDPTTDETPIDEMTETGGGTATMEHDGPSSAPPPGSPPPSSGPAPGPRRSAPNGLTRDPYSALGGVASGIAHRYGLSTALVRLVFVVVLFATFFFALPIYLAAWAIIPRATIWPPEALRVPGQKFSSRDLGVIALIGGLIAFLVFGVDGVGSVLVALAFVLSGALLLLQHERQPAPPAPDAVATSHGAAPQPAPLGQPVPPRSTGRKVFLGLTIGGVVLFFASLVAIPIAFIAWGDLDSVDFDRGTFDFRFDDEVALIDVAPVDIEDLPDPIDAGAGDITIDLSDIDVAEFESLDAPAVLDIELGNGDIDIIVPDGVEYSIVADVDRGDIDAELNGERLTTDGSGRGESLTVVNDDADLELRIDLRRGDLDIESD